ncbi:2OG-Fe(II) oxygenase [Amaricoccus sp.]|uniref:2OG-Fe(II) oxygenase family protein n=1 Tax=Amaricoccus sp. TaxID=1872485 RepID=UPI001B54CF31|nr:2OG-Fe(II) oxygenase [Amaricoccus sp.]MBP7000861.1 2OG-Fe(II) oxygenase [Amaricoccus sp.]
MPDYVNLLPGDPAPWFRARTAGNPRYAFDSAGGRYLVLLFFGTAADPHARAALAAAAARPDLFDDARASLFGVTADPADEAQGRVADRLPGIRFFLDFDGAVGRAFGALPVAAPAPGEGLAVRRMWMILDPTLRIIDVIPFAPDRSDIAAALDRLAALPPPARFAGVELQAPIILLPGVFEPELCARLIARYEAHGGEESGVMRDVEGKTVAVMDQRQKRRKDHVIEDQALIGELQSRFLRRVVPEIRKVHQFEATRMERYLVACYAAEDGGHFAAHRDNTTHGTAHRRFAVSVNLNDAFDGGEVSFPEYGTRGFKAPPGGAVVFSCSLLHAVSRVTSGRRYAFLPFLYDEAAAKLREANMAKVSEDISGYKA